jgi:phage FluMu protein Com
MPPPIVERLKIRCYRCNQLLAVAPSKAGTVVACPKCKADLLIPKPGPPAEEPTDPSVVGLKSETFPSLAPVTESTTGRGGPPSASYLDEIAALIPPEVASLRPEDLRVEAEVFEAITRQPSPPPPAEDPFSLPAALTAADFSPPPVAVEPAPAPPEEVPAFLTTTGATYGASGAAQAPPPLPIPATAPESAVVVPPIRLEPEAIRPTAAAEPRTIREVVLPASVVLAWSLFVLAAIPMAFLAGLMIGHFLWKAGP